MFLPPPLRLLLIACCALPLLAHAGDGRTVYKCSAGGKTAYADRPCDEGTSVRLPPPPVGVDPNVDAVRTGDARTLLETEKLRARLAQRQQVQRARDAQHAERDQARLARAAAARRQRCERARLHVKRAAEDLGRAALRKQEAARTRLHRREETMAAACRA